MCFIEYGLVLASSRPFVELYGNMVRYKVFNETDMKMTVFYDVTMCSLVEINTSFRGAL
jgi:hypothetical protein